MSAKKPPRVLWVTWSDHYGLIGTWETRADAKSSLEHDESMRRYVYTPPPKPPRVARKGRKGMNYRSEYLHDRKPNPHYDPVRVAKEEAKRKAKKTARMERKP